MTSAGQGSFVSSWDETPPLTIADVEALVATTTDSRVHYPASAWISAYHLALSLGFTDTTAHVQAGAAWDRAAEELAEATAIVVGVN